MVAVRFVTQLPENVLIKRETNPWLELADQDGPLNLQDLREEVGILSNDGSCEECSTCMIRGTIEAMDTPVGIQRCDACERFEGDLEAAEALAGALDDFYIGVIRHQVYFETEEEA